MIGRRSYDYLKAVYKLGGLPGSECWASVSQVAAEVGVSLPTASIMLRRLAQRGFLEVREGHGVRLTEEGLEALFEYLWKHGILEVAFARIGLDPDRAKEAAEALADRLPREIAETLCQVLGNPKACPHGHPIPEPQVALGQSKPALYCGLEPARLSKMLAEAFRRASRD